MSESHFFPLVLATLINCLDEFPRLSQEFHQCVSKQLNRKHWMNLRRSLTWWQYLKCSELLSGIRNRMMVLYFSWKPNPIFRQFWVKTESKQDFPNVFGTLIHVNTWISVIAFACLHLIIHRQSGCRMEDVCFLHALKFNFFLHNPLTVIYFKQNLISLDSKWTLSNNSDGNRIRAQSKEKNILWRMHDVSFGFDFCHNFILSPPSKYCIYACACVIKNN